MRCGHFPRETERLMLLNCLASNTCGGPGCLDSWLCWFLVLREKPTQLVLCFLLASFLALLLFDTLFPLQFVLVMGFSWPLVVIFRLRVLRPLPVPFLGSPANRMLVTQRKQSCRPWSLHNSGWSRVARPEPDFLRTSSSSRQVEAFTQPILRWNQMTRTNTGRRLGLFQEVTTTKYLSMLKLVLNGKIEIKNTKSIKQRR